MTGVQTCALPIFNRNAQHRQIFHSFSEAGIPFFTVKGLDVARFYPVPALRTMGDSDIVIHPEDKDKAHAVMTGLGYQTMRKANIEWIYSKGGLVFEIHDRLLYDMPFNSKAGLESVDQAWDHAAPMGEGTRYEVPGTFVPVCHGMGRDYGAKAEETVVRHVRMCLREGTWSVLGQPGAIYSVSSPDGTVLVPRNCKNSLRALSAERRSAESVRPSRHSGVGGIARLGQ